MLAALKIFGLGAFNFLKGISPRTWLYIAIALALAVGFIWHQRAAHKALQTADATGYERAMKEVEAMALALKAKADRLNAEIVAQERKRNNEENLRIARDADALRVRGPGKATCPGHSSVPGPAGGREPTSGQASPAVAGVPDAERVDLIALPFAPTIDGAERADLNRTEVLSWREWHRRLLETWPR